MYIVDNYWVLNILRERRRMIEYNYDYDYEGYEYIILVDE